VRLSLVTAFYPGVEPFLADWYRSVQQQTEPGFDLWIALDGLTPAAAVDAMGGDGGATWVSAEPGDSPALVRQRVLEQVIAHADVVVLVDSDDILHPNRVADARVALLESEMAGCALRLVDAAGSDLGSIFTLPSGRTIDAVLPRHNVFGLSNTAWRAGVLRRCLPIPSAVELVDWFLATRAWLVGVRQGFDPAVGMDYRQHGANMARVKAPFDREQVMRDTVRVQRHFSLVQGTPLEGVRPERLSRLAEVAAEVDCFASRVLPQVALLDRYLNELNALDPDPLWWSCVAHPSLNHLWT